MAITFVGSAEVGSLNGADATLDLTGIALQQNDIVVLTYSFDNTLATDNSGITSAGWTQIYEGFDTVGSGVFKLGVYYKIMGASPDSSVVVDGTGIQFTAMSVVAMAFRGINQSVPQDAVFTHFEDLNVDPDPAAITTVTDGAAVIVCAGGDRIDNSITAPSGYGNQVDIATSDTFKALAAMAWKEVASAGVENPGTWTNWSLMTYQVVTVALRPAGASNEGDGEADGHATAVGGGGRINNLVGAADGHATSLGEGSRLVAGGGDGAATGHSTTSGIGAPFFSAPGLVAGHATAIGASQEASSSADGLAVGTSTASGIFAVRRPKVRAINASIISGRGKLRVTHTGLPNENF
jgi:hypothetical protein